MNNYFQGILLFTPPLKSLAEFLKILPPPGQGPSQQQMKEGFLKVTGIGEGVKGNKASFVMAFYVDPGYLDTARMLVESGLCLLQSNNLPSNTGILTPAAGLGDMILQRLIDTGTSFAIS